MGGWNVLAKLMAPQQATPGMLGSGMAAKAASQVGSDEAYRQHVIDAQLKGEEPMTREEFMKSRQG